MALRAKVDADIATAQADGGPERSKSSSDEYRDRARRDEEAAMLVQAQAARHSNFSPSVDAGGRQMIGLNGRVLAPPLSALSLAVLRP